MTIDTDMEIIFKSVSATSKYFKGDRVVVRFDADDWYLGTVLKANAGTVTVGFDDGEEHDRSENFRMMHKVPVDTKKRKKALTDAQAKGLKSIEEKEPKPKPNMQLTNMGKLIEMRPGVTLINRSGPRKHESKM